jgi:adenylate cyclase
MQSLYDYRLRLTMPRKTDDRIVILDEKSPNDQESGTGGVHGGREPGDDHLFLEVRGFTTISEGMDPGGLSLLMNEFLAPLSRVVYQHHGKMDKYRGDCIMAFWAPRCPVRSMRGMRSGGHQDAANPAAATVAYQGARLDRDSYRVRHQYRQDKCRQHGIRSACGLYGDGRCGQSRLAPGGYCQAIRHGHHHWGNTRETVPDIVYRELDRVRVKDKDKPVAIYEPLALSGEVGRAVLDEFKMFHQALRRYRRQEWDGVFVLETK